MSPTPSRLLAAAATTALALGAAAAHAQSVDYGALEQLFNEPVTTSATGSPQRVTDVPADMTIITADDIKRSGATDLPTILSRVAGIDVLNWSAGDTDVGVRGYDQGFSPRLLVLIDGREVYLDDFGYTSWSTLPVTLAEIRQIEVVRGPNSALFGFNAVGGVINIITFNPKYDDINTVEAHGGTQDDVGGSIAQTLHLGDRVSMRLSAGGERQDQWRNDAADPTVWTAHGMADVIVQVTPTSELRLQGSSARSGYLDVDSYPSTYTTNSIMATSISDTLYGEIQAQFYSNQLHDKNTSPFVGALDLKYETDIASLQDLFKIGTRSTFRIALQYRYNEGNTTPLDAGRIGYRVLAPSAMWNFAATSRLSLTAAARLDHLQLMRSGPEPQGFVYSSNSDWDRTIDSLSLNLGAVYRLTGLDTLRATYARGIQSPTLVELGLVQTVIAPGPYGLSLGGNPYLQPAVVSNYEVSYDRLIQALNVKASAKLFFQQTEGVKGSWDATQPVLPTTPGIGAEAVVENASNSTMSGLELEVSGRRDDGFHWSADTTYTHVTDRAIGDYNLLIRQTAFASTTPQFRGNIAAGWSDDRWSVDAYVHYVTAYEAYDQFVTIEPSPAYVTLAARVAYRLRDGLIAAVSGQNLGAPRQIQGLASGLQAPRRVIFSLTKSW